jgi:hypothetical protein
MIRSLVVSFSLVSMLVATPVIGCWLCKRTPSGWGFCRPDYNWGYNDCTDTVKDAFNGTTTCILEGSQCPYDPSGSQGGGTGIGGGDSGDCWWTTVYGDGCIMYY